MPTSLSQVLMESATGSRHGLVLPPQETAKSMSDIADVHNFSVPAFIGDSWQSSSGGVSHDKRAARLAAIAEDVERYAARVAAVPLKTRREIAAGKRIDAEDWTLFSPRQREEKDFPHGRLYDKKLPYTNVFNLLDGQETWVPQPLVVLRNDYRTNLPTSSGLAAGTTVWEATLRSVQEIIERDALMATWLHCLKGRVLDLPKDFKKAAAGLGGFVRAFDLTPDYSPLPVVAVAGSLPQRGKWRQALGLACRSSYEQAITKAYLEWCQGVCFAGIYPEHVDTSGLREADDVRTFSDHAIYYTRHPKEWLKLPLLRPGGSRRPHRPALEGSPETVVRQTTEALAGRGIRLFIRSLTTIDALQAGLHVTRAISPDLIPINFLHRWPCLGGNAADLRLRYPDGQTDGIFPSRFPHPLG